MKPEASRRSVVLVCADHYLPGYKAGGPIRTLGNLVVALGDDFAFRIITRDRDLGAASSFAGVDVDRWNKVGKASVFYASPAVLGPAGMRRLLRETPHDLLYLNSFFSPRMSILPLLLRRLGGCRALVVAPRGEFAPAALALKPVRKRVYLRVARALGLLRGARWQATNEVERGQIRSVAQASPAAIALAANPLNLHPQSEPRGERRPGPLRVIFLSRIAPMKNLDYLLDAIAQVHAALTLTVIGPVGDPAYWAACRQRADSLPPHIGFNYAGELAPERVPQAFADHDLFVLPTRGENFGHAIFESLAAGTPAIISDRTPWIADHAGGLTLLPLTATTAWTAAIEQWAAMEDHDLAARRNAARQLALEHLAASDAVAATRELFRQALATAARADGRQRGQSG